MASGKTTVGLKLAKAFSMPFFDSDEVIEQRNGVPISTIFDIEGEEGFRAREMEVIEELTAKDRIVLSTGGGAVIKQKNRQSLCARGFVVYLRVSASTILKRTCKDKKRPLLQGDNPEQMIKEILQQRTPLYEEIADLIIDTDNCVTREIVKMIYNYEVNP